MIFERQADESYAIYHFFNSLFVDRSFYHIYVRKAKEQASITGDFNEFAFVFSIRSCRSYFWNQCANADTCFGDDLDFYPDVLWLLQKSVYGIKEI